MTRIIKNAGCGNSPKNLLVQALVIAIETANGAAFSRCVSDDLDWAIPGRKSFVGKAAALAYLKSGKPGALHEVKVRRAISHGRAGAADGTLILASGLTRGFCHVVEFCSVKGVGISSICSYYSDLGDGDQ
jgi:hypothetical protein